MIEWEDPKNPGELKDYRFDWTKDLGSDTISAARASFLSGYSGGMTIVSVSYANPYSIITVSGGTAGLIGYIVGQVDTVGGRLFEETGKLNVIDSLIDTTLSTDQLVKDRARVYAARLEFITGGQIKEVWRDGRRITYALGTLADYDSALAKLDAQIADLTAAAAGTPRRFRALRPRFSRGF